MRLRLALALSISVLFIGTALWFRPTTTDTQSGIIAVEQFGVDKEYDEELLRDFLEPRTAGTTSPENSLSNTEIIGRQLILDYVDLAGSGEATEEDITALAERYAEGIRNLNPAQSISRADIKVIPNTQINLQNYADSLTKIYKEYAESIKRGQIGASPSILNQALYLFARVFSAAYTDIALKLKNMPVPDLLVSTHVQLVNNYFSSAAAMEAVSKTENDSTSAFAALVALNENVDKETALLDEITQILTANGI